MFPNVNTDRSDISSMLHKVSPTTTQLPTRSSLVPSPACIEGFACLQNSNYEEDDPSKFNIDLSIETLDEASAAAAYKAALRIWMDVVRGDMPSTSGSQLPNANECLNDLPELVDDLHICGIDEPIDGVGEVLGSAGPSYIRQNVATGLWTSITGEMTFDAADVANLISQGRYETVIMHEMGHVLGIGTLWSINGLTNTNLDYLGVNAKRVWTEDWGCTLSDSPPIEKDFGEGTAGGHWDEDCFQNEFMTGLLGLGENPLSTVTIASVEDIGYTVDYGAADDYDGSNTNNCCDADLFTAKTLRNEKLKLSTGGKAAAFEYGLKMLHKKQRPQSIFLAATDHDDTIRYVGDKFLVVFYQENGAIYDVIVTNE